MATPITSIKKNEQTTEEVQQQKLIELQGLIVEQEQAIQKIIGITAELNEAGILDAMNAMLKAKDDLAEIAVQQASKEQMTNLINNVMNASSILTSLNPEVTAKLVASLNGGLHEAQQTSVKNDKVSVFQLMKAVNDPDINRAIKFGLDFLKGMGKELDTK